MLNSENLKEFIKKFQTNQKNIIREYIQNLFLANLYRIDGAEKLLFKGGTALRLIYSSPRFSEDLDFTAHGIRSHGEIDDLFISTLTELEKMNIDIAYKEAKPTTGGYLGVIHYNTSEQSEDMKFEVSLRKVGSISGELITIASELVPPYVLMQISPKKLVSGKMDALLSRKKPRDYYDLYFMLRNQELNRLVDKKILKKASENLKSERIDFKKELSVLLPASHQMILKNFVNILSNEIKKYL